MLSFIRIIFEYSDDREKAVQNIFLDVLNPRMECVVQGLDILLSMPRYRSSIASLSSSDTSSTLQSWSHSAFVGFVFPPRIAARFTALIPVVFTMSLKVSLCADINALIFSAGRSYTATGIVTFRVLRRHSLCSSFSSGMKQYTSHSFSEVVLDHAPHLHPLQGGGVLRKNVKR